jgi:hypothetical protein
MSASRDCTWPLMKADFCETDLRGIRYGARYGTRTITNSFGDWDLRPWAMGDGRWSHEPSRLLLDDVHEIEIGRHLD